jgi:tRNA U34 5-methylaminomethyl-2-thiouridine-forming methyltransferase MnmC
VNNRYVKVSDDGSHTIYNPAIDEHYHSKFGAITESVHIFIQNGMNMSNKNPLHILEIGFGTGLNAFLSYNEAIKRNIEVHYCGIELYPLEMNTINDLNYPKVINPNLQNDFNSIHLAPWDTEHTLNDSFSFKKIKGSAIEIELTSQFDVIFFDAFSPEKQLELWSVEMFKKIYENTNTGGILTTYCAKGIVKRALREAGFKVEVLEGPPGKRHMVRAVKVSVS